MKNINVIKERLMERAKKKYKRIFPCSKSRKFKDCYTRHDKNLYFWFDTKDRNTHMVYEKVIC